ncbi:hypothetical protein EDD21DRAFT_392628, partial [Dissophora ornata]
MLTAGSLFLLPSILPYVASAFTFYTSAPSSSFTSSSASLSATNAEAVNECLWNWDTAWVLLLPCVGILIPLLAFKVMSHLEESRRFQRWRQGNNHNSIYRGQCTTRYVGAATCRTFHPENTATAARIAWVMPSPTTSAVKKIWRTLVGDPPGYGPLALDTSVGSNARGLLLAPSDPPSPTSSESDFEHEYEEVEGARCTCDDSQNGMSESQFSVLPRPKTILMTSLGIWTLLMALSSVFGLNTITTIKSVIPTRTNDVRPQWTNTLRQGGFVVLDEDNETDDMAEREGEFMNALKSLLDSDEPIENFFAGDSKDLDEAIWVSNEDDFWANERVEGEEPFEIIKNMIFIANKRGQHQQQQREVMEEEGAADVPEDVSEQDVEEFLELDSLDAMTMDPEDAHIFQDFLAQLEAEDEAVKTVEETLEQGQYQQQVDSSMSDNDLPCGYRSRNMPRFTPEWIFGTPEMVQKMMDQVAPDHLAAAHERGQVFDYLTSWTDMMILAATMCLGSLLVGLAQAKSLYYQLLEHHQASYTQEEKTRDVAGGRASLVTLASCLLMAGSALGLSLLMVFAECWDVPSIYFVGIGIAGMILVHSWVPNMALQIDFTHSYSDDDYEEDEEEKAVGGASTAAATMTERRNACSLDESRRWEVASRPLSASCFT